MRMTKVLEQLGLGCAGSCVCRMAFEDSLSEKQRELFLHLAKKGLKAQAAAVEEAQEGQDESGDEQSVFAQFLASVVENGIDEGGDVYEGDLPERIVSSIEAMPEEVRSGVETSTRQVIAQCADGNPDFVYVMQGDDGFFVGVIDPDSDFSDLPEEMPEGMHPEKWKAILAIASARLADKQEGVDVAVNA